MSDIRFVSLRAPAVVHDRLRWLDLHIKRLFTQHNTSHSPSHSTDDHSKCVCKCVCIGFHKEIPALSPAYTIHHAPYTINHKHTPYIAKTYPTYIHNRQQIQHIDIIIRLNSMKLA